jgi:hypothetical protein
VAVVVVGWEGVEARVVWEGMVTEGVRVGLVKEVVADKMPQRPL